MSLKPDVRAKGVQPEILLGLVILERLFARYRVDLVVTSLLDGEHMPGSLHYKGLAADVRSREVDVTLRAQLLREARVALGPDFDFILESDHFHLEFDPKGVKS
jgi:hypothetical protein